jgi:hypothetical protein
MLEPWNAGGGGAQGGRRSKERGRDVDGTKTLASLYSPATIDLVFQPVSFLAIN